MNTFEITIQHKAETGWPVVVDLSGEKIPLVVHHEGMLELDLTALQSQGTPRDYGILLGRTLFRDAIHEAFLQARAESEEDHLSVLLFVEDPELRNLHWERLCAPLDLDDHWDFLALDQRAPLTLSVPSGTQRFFRQIGQRDLRALVVVTSPQGLQRYQLAPFDVETVVSNVRSALGTIPCDVLATTPDAVGPPTLDELCTRLTMAPYTLLHIVCHGRYLPDSGETVLYLADEHNQVEPLEGSRLLERLREGCALPHFVFLATCESGSPQAEGVLGGLAQRLVCELGLPAVLAMTEQISITTEQALASQFYPQLLQAHGYLSVALVEACAGLAERPDVTVPVLYSRLGAHPLFEQQVTSSTTSLDRQDRVNLIKAPGKSYREALKSSPRGIAEIALAVLLVCLLLGSGLNAFFLLTHHSTVGASPIVGQALFVSSGQVNQATAQGSNDEFQIDLHGIADPQPGKSYYAWLLGDSSQSEAPPILLGKIPVNHGNAHFLYPGESEHANLLGIASRLLITEEDADVTPIVPSPDLTTWRYYAELSQTRAAGQTYSLLDHLRHLLARDPTLESLHLAGGLSPWALRNTQKVLEWAGGARDDWSTKDFASMHRQIVSILDYLDGAALVWQDVPPGTPILADPRIAQVGLLELNPGQQNPPGYLYHIALHVNGVLASPGATPYQRQLAVQIDTALSNVQGWLEQVRRDAVQLVGMSDTQLALPSSLALLDDMAAQVTYAYVGRNDPSTGRLQEGVTQFYLNVQRLATFEVKLYW